MLRISVVLHYGSIATGWRSDTTPPQHWWVGANARPPLVPARGALFA
jgi:hypothetical protein